LVLSAAVGRPFGVGGAVLRTPAEGQLLEVVPSIQARLPQDRAARLASLDGVSLAVPVLAEPTPLAAGDRQAGALLLAADGCRLGPLLQADPCVALAGRTPTPGPGVPVVVSATLASALGVGPGDPLALPGGRPGDAHVGLVAED